MHNHNLPATLSACVRIFLETLCDEAMATALESRTRPVSDAHPQPQSSAIRPH